VSCPRDVVVAVTPQLYGRDPAEPGRVVDRTLADPEVVPLVGVAGATERAYATATITAREQAIAASIESQCARHNAPAVSVEEAQAAIARAEAAIARARSRCQLSGWGDGLGGAFVIARQRVLVGANSPPRTSKLRSAGPCSPPASEASAASHDRERAAVA
jgi:hypothetical protein